MAVNSNLKAQITALTNRMNGLAGNASAEELVYLSKAAETLGASATIFDMIDYADDKVKEITDTATAKKAEVTTTGNTQAARVATEGDTQVARVGAAGDAEVTRINNAYSILDASGATRVNFGTGTAYTALSSIRTRIEVYADDTTPFRSLNLTLFNPAAVTDPPFPAKYTIRNRSYQNVVLKNNAGTLLLTIPPHGAAEVWRTKTAWTNAQLFGYRGFSGRPKLAHTNPVTDTTPPYDAPAFQISAGHNYTASAPVYPHDAKSWGAAVELDANGDPARLWQFGRAYNSSNANPAGTWCMGHNYINLPIATTGTTFSAAAYTYNGVMANATGSNIQNACPVAWSWALKFGMIFCFKDSAMGSYRTWKSSANNYNNYLSEVDSTTAGIFDSVYAVQFNDDRILFVFRNASVIRVVGYRCTSVSTGPERMGEATVNGGQFAKISDKEFVLSTPYSAVVYDVYANNTLSPTASLGTHPLGSTLGIGLYWGGGVFTINNGTFAWNGTAFTKVSAATAVVGSTYHGNLMELAPGVVYQTCTSPTYHATAKECTFYSLAAGLIMQNNEYTPDIAFSNNLESIVPFRDRLLHIHNTDATSGTQVAYSTITEIELGYRNSLGHLFKEAV